LKKFQLFSDFLKKKFIFRKLWSVLRKLHVAQTATAAVAGTRPPPPQARSRRDTSGVKTFFIYSGIICFVCIVSAELEPSIPAPPESAEEPEESEGEIARGLSEANTVLSFLCVQSWKHHSCRTWLFRAARGLFFMDTASIAVFHISTSKSSKFQPIHDAHHDFLLNVTQWSSQGPSTLLQQRS
jgi:hypothetical protein